VNIRTFKLDLVRQQLSLIFSKPEGPDRRKDQGLHYHKTR